MTKITFDPIFQSVGKQSSIQMIEMLGPIYCTKNPWLGRGYYFWDGFVELAQWWGCKHYNSSYYICQAKMQVSSEYVFDLVGCTHDMIVFNTALKMLKNKLNCQSLTVAAVLAAMRKMTSFPYKVIRARSEHNVFANERICFVENDFSYMNTIPAIQICVMDKKLVKDFHVITVGLFQI